MRIFQNRGKSVVFSDTPCITLRVVVEFIFNEAYSNELVLVSIDGKSWDFISFSNEERIIWMGSFYSDFLFPNFLQSYPASLFCEFHSKKSHHIFREIYHASEAAYQWYGFYLLWCQIYIPWVSQIWHHHRET